MFQHKIMVINMPIVTTPNKLCDAFVFEMELNVLFNVISVDAQLKLHIVKDVMKLSIHPSHHTSVHLFGHPSIQSWSVYSNGAEKKWNMDAVDKKWNTDCYNNKRNINNRKREIMSLLK